MTNEAQKMIDLLKFENIDEIYVGQDECCRCGCKGTYAKTSHSEPDYKTPDDKLVARRLNKAKSLIEQGAEFEYDPECGYLNIVSGNDRAYTVYFIKQLKVIRL